MGGKVREPPHKFLDGLLLKWAPLAHDCVDRLFIFEDLFTSRISYGPVSGLGQLRFYFELGYLEEKLKGAGLEI